MATLRTYSLSNQHLNHVGHAESAGWHRKGPSPRERSAAGVTRGCATKVLPRKQCHRPQAMALVSGGAPRLERDDVNESVPEVVAFLVARPRAHPLPTIA
jgi:hypothetical protein